MKACLLVCSEVVPTDLLKDVSQLECDSVSLITRYVSDVTCILYCTKCIIIVVCNLKFMTSFYYELLMLLS